MPNYFISLLKDLRRPPCCDECGKLFPPRDIGGRITLCCSDVNGAYRGGDGLRHNGKVFLRHWRSPIIFRSPLG